MHRLTQLYCIRSDGVNHGCDLRLAANFDEFLRKVVAEGVVHELREVLNSAVKDSSCQLFVILTDLLLKEATAALVLGKLCGVPGDQVKHLRAFELLVAFQGFIGGGEAELRRNQAHWLARQLIFVFLFIRRSLRIV